MCHVPLPVSSLGVPIDLARVLCVCSMNPTGLPCRRTTLRPALLCVQETAAKHRSVIWRKRECRCLAAKSWHADRREGQVTKPAADFLAGEECFTAPAGSFPNSARQLCNDHIGVCGRRGFWLIRRPRRDWRAVDKLPLVAGRIDDDVAYRCGNKSLPMGQKRWRSVGNECALEYAMGRRVKKMFAGSHGTRAGNSRCRSWLYARLRYCPSLLHQISPIMLFGVREHDKTFRGQLGWPVGLVANGLVACHDLRLSRRCGPDAL